MDNNRRNFLKLVTSLLFAPTILIEPQERFHVSYDGVGQYDNDFNYDDIYLSKEAWEDIRNWGVDKLDEETKREIYYNGV